MIDRRGSHNVSHNHNREEVETFRVDRLETQEAQLIDILIVIALTVAILKAIMNRDIMIAINITIVIITIIEIVVDNHNVLIDDQYIKTIHMGSMTQNLIEIHSRTGYYLSHDKWNDWYQNTKSYI